MGNNNSSLGKFAEDFAAKIYAARGFKIAARNFSNPKGKRMGELDLVAVKNSQIRFVEVKCRTSDKFGIDLEILTRAKSGRMRLISEYFLKNFPCYGSFSRHFDFVFVQVRGTAPFDKKSYRIKIYSDCMI